MSKFRTLGEHIIQSQKEVSNSTGELTSILSCIKLATKVVNSEINKAGLVDEIMGQMGNTNIQGEDQQKLDVYANEKFIAAFKARAQICGVASEEEDSFIAFESESCRGGKYVVLIDPLDGSSNIDVNVSIGTIFSIYRRVTPVGQKAELRDFLQKGTEIVAAGYIIYGSSTMLVLSVGDGVHGFTFDPSIGVFFLSNESIKFPKTGKIYSLNEGNYPFFSDGIKSFLQYCKEDDPQTGRPMTSRYIGSMVSDFHRNMIKGGIYLYPSTKTAPKGKLRLLYECKPMAFLAEQAGGIATDGKQRILDIEPTELHQRSPFIVGSPDLVSKLSEYLDQE